MSEPRDNWQEHDAFFKSTFGNIQDAASILRTILPEGLAKLANWASLKLVNNESSQAQVGRSDLQYRVEVDGIEADLFVLCEHLCVAPRKCSESSYELYFQGQ